MTYDSKTLEEYLIAIPEDRREPISKLRDAIKRNLNPGFEEGIQYGMIGFFVPHSVFPDGYHCDPKQPLPFAHIASQKNSINLYLMCTYGDKNLLDWFVAEYAKMGKKFDMGKSCFRFKKAEDIPYDLVGQLISKITVDDYLNTYLSNLSASKKKGASKS